MSKLTRMIDRSPVRANRLALAGIATAALAGIAVWTARKARAAEREAPPKGAMLDVDGVRLHYVERGQGPALVLLHGNALRLEDFIASGLIDRLADHYRVIAFDRPGFGHSDRPRSRLWTADAQAGIVRAALSQLDVEAPIVLGHSWGTLVAIALALRDDLVVRKLVLVSGYYFPRPRLDAALAAINAVPVVGDLMRYTMSAILARLLLKRTVDAMFRPQSVPPGFLAVLGRELLVRPSQIRANSEDAAFMMTAASSLSSRYNELDMPITILAGEADTVIDPDAHARRLHRELPNSELKVVPGLGHMLHHAAPDLILKAVALKASTGAREPVPARPLVVESTVGQR